MHGEPLGAAAPASSPTLHNSAAGSWVGPTAGWSAPHAPPVPAELSARRACTRPSAGGTWRPSQSVADGRACLGTECGPGRVCELVARLPTSGTRAFDMYVPSALLLLPVMGARGWALRQTSMLCLEAPRNIALP
eukprot:178965-Chlamydomonas_euryale.AAC.1